MAAQGSTGTTRKRKERRVHVRATHEDTGGTYMRCYSHMVCVVSCVATCCVLTRRPPPLHAVFDSPTDTHLPNTHTPPLPVVPSPLSPHHVVLSHHARLLVRCAPLPVRIRGCRGAIEEASNPPWSAHPPWSHNTRTQHTTKTKKSHTHRDEEREYSVASISIVDLCRVVLCVSCIVYVSVSDSNLPFLLCPSSQATTLAVRPSHTQPS